jgi:hypothetical protein
MASGQFLTSLGIFLKGDFDRNPSLRAKDWNARIASQAEQCLILPGVYTFAVRTPRGQILNISPNAGWRHPWFTEPVWKGDKWHVWVRPGFVNGMDPEVVGHGDLLDWPLIPLRAFREFPAEEQTPKFFEQFGVPRKGADSVAVDELGNVTVDVTERESTIPKRPLVGCDVWLSVARPAYVSEATVTESGGVAGEVVDYSVRFETSQFDRLGGRARLYVTDKIPEVKPPTIYDRLEGKYQDDGEDRILISTVYFLGPENGTPPVNQAWQPFVAHNCFWNLSHRAKNAVPPKAYEPIRIFTGLAGGWGDLVANQTLSQINEVSEVVFNAVNTTDNVGRFWTA